MTQDQPSATWHTFNQFSAVAVLFASIYYFDAIGRLLFAAFGVDYDAVGAWKMMLAPVLVLGLPWLYWEIMERTRQRRIPIVGLIVVLGLGGGAAYWMWNSAYGRPGLERAAPALVGFDGATIRSPSRSIRVGPEGGTLSLEDGTRITVPRGAFQQAQQLTATIVDLATEAMPAGVEQPRVYAVATEHSIGALAQPVLLELPERADRLVAFTLNEGRWQSIELPAGPLTRVEIDHFSFVYFAVATIAATIAAEHLFNISDAVLGALEGWTQRFQKLERLTKDEDPVALNARRKKENSDVLVRAFFGVGEYAVQPQEDICDGFESVLRRYDNPQSRKVPLRFPIDTVGWLWQRGVRYFSSGEQATAQNDMSMFLQVAEAPKSVGGEFYRVVDLSYEPIHRELLSHSEQISIAQFLQIAIDANDGNIPLGMLAAHNVLKDITYLGRDGYASNRDISEYGLLASKLQSYRQDANIKPGSDDYDKMGPIYHVFAAMTAAYWLPFFIGENVDSAEQILRKFSVGADVPDTEQATADDCGIIVGLWAYHGMPPRYTRP